MTTHTTTPPVRKTTSVRTSPEHPPKVFTEGFDTWWPRGHHIGSSPMIEAIVEPRAGGRCFSRQADGTTRVDLEHRHFERHGAGGSAMRAGVESPDGWGSLLELFAGRAEQSPTADA